MSRNESNQVMAKDRLRQGRGEREWLFPNEEGNPMDESRVRKAFKRALKRQRSRSSGSTTCATRTRAYSSLPMLRSRT
jgi:hypothetical protein